MGTLKPQHCGNWYTGRWWVGCYIWYSEEGPAWAGWGSAQAGPSSPTKCNSPPINGECTNFNLFDVALYLPLYYKGLKTSSYDR